MCCVMHLLKIKSYIVTNDVKSSLSDMMMWSLAIVYRVGLVDFDLIGRIMFYGQALA